MNLLASLVPCVVFHHSSDGCLSGDHSSDSDSGGVGRSGYSGRWRNERGRLSTRGDAPGSFVLVRRQQRMTGGRMGVAASNLNGDQHSQQSQGGNALTADLLVASSPTTPPPTDHVRERKRLRVTGFATFRKKLIRKARRSSKACDHGRTIREAVSDWSALELAALFEEYEALAALKDLSVQAELARPPAATYKQDLSTLYDFKYCTDVDLIFRGACFPVHRAILSARCTYFRELLSGYPGYGARICLDLCSPGIDVEMFSALLRYLYTGDLSPGVTGNTMTLSDLSLVRRLGDEFGRPSPLDRDLRYLLDTGDFADAVLVFTSGETGTDHYQYGFRTKLELPCHKAILSARSPFFRNLIQRRSRSGEEQTERALHIPARIVLDESVIPKRYARVLLHAIYLDTVDLSLILRGNGCNSSGSLGEAESITNNGRARPTPLEEAMELYQIGRFLELDIVSQGCEDVILEWLTIESLPGVLRWASEGHGSSWVLRQAKHFLREEFCQIAHSPVLFQLDKEHLANALNSHFLQASELEVLQAVLKWGEHRLVRRMEDREPNVVSQTAHSVTRKGVKKRDLSDVELREILSELLPLVRMDHVIPADSETLSQAIRRGLVSNPPSHMIGSDQRGGERINAWVRTSHSQHSGLFVRPRLFMPYYEEIKALVEEQLVGEGELIRVRRARYIPDIPDTLYMVEDKPRSLAPAIDVIAQTIPAPDTATMNAMLKRETELRQSAVCQTAASLPLSSRHEINRQIRLRVVREYNLPDQVAHLLENAAIYRAQHEDEDDTITRDNGASSVPYQSLTSNSCLTPSSFSNRLGSRTSHSRLLTPSPVPTPSPGPSLTPAHQQILPAIVTEGISNYQRQQLAAGVSWRTLPASPGSAHSLPGGGSGHLSRVMPDIAMATASLDRLSLDGSALCSHSNYDELPRRHHTEQDEDEEDELVVEARNRDPIEEGEIGLDLGDGASHHHSHNHSSSSSCNSLNRRQITSRRQQSRVFMYQSPPPPHRFL